MTLSLLRRAAVPALAALLLLPAGGRSAAAQNLPAVDSLPRPGLAMRVAASRIRVDGTLDEAAWAELDPVEIPFEWSPGDNVAAPVRTECRLTYDDQNLYLGCTAHDARPSLIRARLVERDAPVRDDYVGLLIDPFNDQRQGFFFRVTPLGVQMDGAYGASGEDPSWDAIWTAAGRLTDEGYVVEVAIPFKSLRFPRTGGPQTWGMILERSYPRSTHHRMRSIATDPSNSCLLCQAAGLQGLVGITPGNNVELIPTVTVARSDEPRGEEDPGLVAGATEVRPGLTARWGITPSISLAGTLNPDFSQVEADAAQLTVNRRFALFFPEKRPFFLEGAEYFQTPRQMVFTRTVVEPTAGAKITGKEGAHAMGMFLAADRVNTVLLPANQGSSFLELPGEATTGVVRYRRDLGESSSLGMLYTGRLGQDYRGQAAGVDGFIRVSRRNSLRFQLTASETDYPDSLAAGAGQRTGSFLGSDLLVQLNHSSRSWNGHVRYSNVSPGFRADAGYVPRADVRGFSGRLERVVWGRPGGAFSRLSVAGVVERLEDYQGVLTDQVFTLGSAVTGPRQSTLGAAVHHRRELFAGRHFDLFQKEAQFDTRPNSWLELILYVDASEQIDFENAREAFMVDPYVGVKLWAGRRLNVDMSHTWPRMTTRDGQEVFHAAITQGRVMYNLDARTAVRVTLQRSLVVYNPEASAQPVSPDASTQLAQVLFSYQANPQTVVFAGYSDDRAAINRNPLEPVGRAFFLKVGYAWRP